MAGIPDSIIEEVRAASDLVDVVSDRVRLKKQGSSYIGLCPFHNEKSPSFNVVPDKGFFHCFGCLDADEPVWTRRGLVPIRDVEVGDRVLGVDGAEEVVLEVLPKRGSVLGLHLGAVQRDPLLVTADHTCLVVREREAVHAVPMLYRDSERGVRFQSRKHSYLRPRSFTISETRADEVCVGDYILFPVIPDADRSSVPLPSARASVPEPELVSHVGMPRRQMGPVPITFEGLPVSERTARLYGLWLAEGSVYRGGVRWSFHIDEGHLAREVVDTLRDEFGLYAAVHERPERALVEVTCSNTHLSYLLPQWFGKGAAGKRVPGPSLWWPSPIQGALLDAYVEGDGAKIGTEGTVATSLSLDLIRGMYAMAVQSRRPVSLWRGPDRTSAGNEIVALSLRSRENTASFYFEHDGQVHYWCRVSEVGPLEGDREVVDINVTGSRTFTTKLGAVHNCRESGDVFSFVQKIEGAGFLDAVRLLADRAGIEIREEGASTEGDRKAGLHAALRFAAGYFYTTLGTPEGERAVEYLKGRGFSKDAVREFGIGVSTPAWDGLVQAATEAGYKPDVLEAVGLAKPRQGGGFYDVFRDRLMFPILSPIGKVLGFGGRILPDTQTGSDDYSPAKYINSPESEIYQKSQVLYGMKQAKRAIRTEREAIIVEGYADVVSLWDAGVRNVVAASGTALTPQQLDALKRLDVQRLVLLFDADEAGQSAAQKGIDRALDAELAPYAVSLPDGADPDSFVRQFGTEAFRTVLRDERMDFVAFLAQRATKAGRLGTPEGKAEVVKGVLATIRRMKDPILVEGYLRRASQELDVVETDLRRMFGGQTPAPPPRRYDRELEAESRARVEVPVVRPEETALIRLMLEQGTPMVEHVLTRMGVDEFTPGPAQEVVQALIAQFEAGKVESAPFVRGDFGEAARILVTDALAERHGLSDNWLIKVGVNAKGRDDQPFATAASAMRLLKLDRVQEAITALTREIQVAERAGRDIAELQGEVGTLNALRRDIDNGTFMDWAG